MLKHSEINPLNVFGLRQTIKCPPHFEKVVFESYVNDKLLSDWIYENLQGRFFIGHQDIIENGYVVKNHTLVAFENPSEASYFSLFLPQINSPHY